MSAAPPPRTHLAEVWGDVVDTRHLGQAILIGAVVSVATYYAAAALLSGAVATPAVAKAYAMLAGMGGCVLSGVICAKLFAPKREVVEDAGDPAWREEAIADLIKETGRLGGVDELPPAARAEMKELGLYDAFAAHEAQHGKEA